jgi:putative lipoic acid-binding regulatory protein
MPGQPRATAPSRELLLANHRFPGPYIIKAFGPASDRFREGIAVAAMEVVGEARAAVAHRTSSRGGKVCVTLTVNAFTVDEVIAVYDRVHQVPDLMLIL